MIKRLHNYLKDKPEEFYGLDYDLKLDDALNLGGIFMTINSCKISDLQVLNLCLYKALPRDLRALRY